MAFTDDLILFNTIYLLGLFLRRNDFYTSPQILTGYYFWL